MKALVTAGPTYEHIDPVRFIGNHSSGKMGIEIAERLKELGYEVVLVIGPTHLTSSDGIRRIDVVSADQMYDACMKEFSTCDVAIMSAAVADYKPSMCSDKKIKRNDDKLTIELIPNKDIAAELGKIKNPTQKLIGFALETNDGVDNAIRKIQSKNLDMIVLNQIGDPGVGFKFDTNKVTIIKPKDIYKTIAMRTHLDSLRGLQYCLARYEKDLEKVPNSIFYQSLVKSTTNQIVEWRNMFFDRKEFETKSKTEVAKDIIDNI